MSLLRKGDTVVVLAGAQRGTTGRILSLSRKHASAIVEGVNLKFKHLRRSQDNPQGGRSQREYPVDLSNLAYWDEDAGKGVRLGVQVNDGTKRRVTRPAGRVIED
ncbi:MAG: 50S ribosomal protein L24 [Planctomycetota bacterium]|nr:MAG: 50S ribosomal protein L24 [Planctomycetota bacterium]